jgi:hypothetical protein
LLQFQLGSHDAANLISFAEVKAVPEPSTSALIFAGIALVGFIARRRLLQ